MYISRLLSIFCGEMRDHSTITVTHWETSHRHKYSVYGNDCPLTCMVFREAFSVHEHSWESYNKQRRASQRSDLSRCHTGDMFTLNPHRVHLVAQGVVPPISDTQCIPMAVTRSLTNLQLCHHPAHPTPPPPPPPPPRVLIVAQCRIHKILNEQTMILAVCHITYMCKNWGML